MEHETEADLEELFDRDPPSGIAGKQPRLDHPWFFNGCDHFRDTLPEPMEHAMFYAYWRDRFSDPDTMNLLWRARPQKRRLTEEEARADFPAWEMVRAPGYVYESYASRPFPELIQREATYAIIFADGRRVAFALDNTYKYQDWGELFGEMIGSEGEICQRRGLHRAFLLYTDSSDTLPFWTLYDKTVAGFAVDSERRRLTAYPAESAVLIFHSLYQLCSAQYGCFVGVTGRSGPAHTYDDSAAAAGDDPYVTAFRERLAQYQECYDEQALIEAFGSR